MTGWLNSNFGLESLKNEVQPLPELQLPTKKGKLDRACETMWLNLNEVRQTLHTQMVKFTQSHIKMQKEIQHNASLRTEIVSDF